MMLVAAVVLSLAVTEPRDPFAAADTAQPKGTTPIQMVAVDALKLQAIVETASPRAMVALPNGAVVFVRVGDVVGDRFGVVTSIAHGRVVVKERLHNAIGETSTSTHVLTTR